MSIINLISGPRNISTALMYAFAQRKDTKVRDEPFYGNYLMRFPEVDHPGREEILAFMKTDLAEIIAELEELSQKYPLVFVKNMSHHHIGIDVSFIHNYLNVFLIRNPKQLIASFAQVMPQPTMQDIGMQRQAELFAYLQANNAKIPLVIDAGEVLKNPEKVLRALCEGLGIDFDPNMLHWKPGQVYDEVPWAKYWYHNVLSSSGFEPQNTSERPLPEHCLPLYEAAQPIYEMFYEYAIKVDSP